MENSARTNIEIMPGKLIQQIIYFTIQKANTSFQYKLILPNTSAIIILVSIVIIHYRTFDLAASVDVRQKSVEAKQKLILQKLHALFNMIKDVIE